jgi:predicted RNase H-like nuclease (RuvC/YqgF family)
MSSEHSIELDEVAFDQALEEVERSLGDLKQRYHQVKQDQQRQQELHTRLQEIEQEATSEPPLKTELRHIQQELETIELNLESNLFRWSQLKEPFWMAVRFGGIGIILGWILKTYAS